jgi:NTP pyrophosphatase (non-canonical NTP hydrolase)
MKNENQDLYKEVINKWGIDSQMLQLAEESLELSHAILKMRRKREKIDDVAEEIADVQIMIEQLHIIHDDLKEKVETMRKIKLERLKNRVRGVRM